MTKQTLRPYILLFAASGTILAQTPTTTGSWRPVNDPAPAQAAPLESQDPSQPMALDAYGQAQQPMAPMAQPPMAQPPQQSYGLPSQVTIRPGTFITMRIDHELASNRNAPGDTFTGTLTQPVVVNGVVVALRGTTVYGRVAEAQKVNGVSRLGVELTSLTLADGSQAQVHTRLISRQGGTMRGEQAAGVITTTTLGGTVIGALAGGSGAAAGAGAGIGAAAGIIGVLATRNRPSVIYPETMMTFEMADAVRVDVASAMGAYRYVGPDDYAQPQAQPTVVQQRPVNRTYVYGGYGPYYDPFYYPYWGGSYWGGSSIFIGGSFRLGGPRYRRFR